MRRLRIEPHFLPSLEYFCALVSFDELVLEGWEHFAKQTYRNRCYVNTADGVRILTVPLVNRRGKVFTKDVRVEAGSQWRNQHWRTIESGYRKAPYFEFYSEDLRKILFAGHDYLYDLNYDLLSFCLRTLGLHKIISASVSYEKRPDENEIDLRAVIIDKKPFEGRPFYLPQPYYQVFGNEFVPNLSIIDLLLCEGPRTLALIKASTAAVNK